MNRVRGTREQRGESQSNSRVMCRYAAASGTALTNAFSFCRYKTASHLHIPQLLKTPCFQSAPRSFRLSPVVCADAKIGGWGDTPVQKQMYGSFPSPLSILESQSPEVTRRLPASDQGCALFASRYFGAGPERVRRGGRVKGPLAVGALLRGGRRGLCAPNCFRGPDSRRLRPGSFGSIGTSHCLRNPFGMNVCKSHFRKPFGMNVCVMWWGVAPSLELATRHPESRRFGTGPLAAASEPAC